jgi:hypothetical protein
MHLHTIHWGTRVLEQGHARQTLVMGPARDWERCDPVELPPGLALGLNAVILCDTPSARMNCSRSSMFVRPLAAIQCERTECEVCHVQGFEGSKEQRWR